MEKLKQLVSKCKASVEISINTHKDYYESVAKHVAKERVDKDILDVMIAKDTVIAVSFYPDTPIGFYTVYHYDIDLAMDAALNILKELELETK